MRLIFGSTSGFTQDPDQLPPASLVAEKLLGTSVFVNWPMMHEAKVIIIVGLKTVHHYRVYTSLNCVYGISFSSIPTHFFIILFFFFVF